jgi:hypothetical protein
MKSMTTPRTRAEIERNFHLLQRQIQDGRLLFSERVSRTMDSLTRVRYLPNGRIDFLSVDEMARLQANMSAQMDQMTPEQIEKDNTAAAQKKETKGGDDPNR